MRNIFDQYGQPENRLTHALLCALKHDRRLLRSFLRRFASHFPMNEKRLHVDEQSVPRNSTRPGTPVKALDSLPDGIIHETVVDESRALAIESKIELRPRADQLKRHIRGVRRRGFVDVAGLLITVEQVKRQPKPWSNILWTQVYEWLRQVPDQSFWKTELLHYFEVAEAQMLEEGYLGPKTITAFSGIAFAENVYSYREAKRHLRLLRQRILKEASACRKLGIDLSVPGRKAITDQHAVWDYFSWKGHPRGKLFTYSPHFTFSIGPDLAEATITIPNGVQLAIRDKLRAAARSEGTFVDATVAFLKKANAAFGRIDGIRPVAKLLQRRYPSQRSEPTKDAELVFDLRTAVPSRRHGGAPKLQPQWLGVMTQVIANRRSNLQFQIGCQFDYELCANIRTPRASELFIDSWRAARKFFAILEVRLQCNPKDSEAPCSSEQFR